VTSLSAAVHSNKKQSYITSFPGQPTSDVRHSLQFAMDIWQRFQMLTPAPPPDGAEWIGIGGARLSLACFVPHNWPRRRIGATRKLVGVAGFEPATPSSRTRCAASYRPFCLWTLSRSLLADNFRLMALDRCCPRQSALWSASPSVDLPFCWSGQTETST
jgi:hypothetical protein